MDYSVLLLPFMTSLNTLDTKNNYFIKKVQKQGLLLDGLYNWNHLFHGTHLNYILLTELITVIYEHIKGLLSEYFYVSSVAS